MSEQLTTDQKNTVEVIARYLVACSKLLYALDGEIQSLGTTGPNPINHTSDDLERTAQYIRSWANHGVDL